MESRRPDPEAGRVRFTMQRRAEVSAGPGRVDIDRAREGDPAQAHEVRGRGHAGRRGSGRGQAGRYHARAGSELASLDVHEESEPGAGHEAPRSRIPAPVPAADRPLPDRSRRLSPGLVAGIIVGAGALGVLVYLLLG